MFAYAADATGNLSAVVSNQVIYVVTSQLTLVTSGAGTITRKDFSGDVLEVGRNYTVTATPNSGNLFFGWEGSTNATNATLTFTMQPDMTLVAEFVTNYFTSLSGDYNGLFYPMDAAGVSNSGSIKLSLTTQGGFSGKLVLEGETLNISGAFDPINLDTYLDVSRTNKPALGAYLRLDSNTNTLTGSVSSTDWQSDLLGFRAAGVGNSFAGTYTMEIMAEGMGMPGSMPQGDGVGVITVSANGTVQFTGTLPDGSALSQSTSVSSNGLCPVFASSLYGNKGLFIGWLSLPRTTNMHEQGPYVPAYWVKPPVAGDPYYPDGFVTQPWMQLRRYTPPASGQNAVGAYYQQLELAAGNLTNQLTAYLAVTNNLVRVMSGTISNLTLTISPTDGQFHGTFKHPVTGKTTSFQGVLMQWPDGTFGSGWFLGTNQSGWVEMWTYVPPEQWVPSSLNGKQVQVSQPDGSWSTLNFGAATYSSFNWSSGAAMGSYTFAKLPGTNASLTLDPTTPPTAVGENSAINITFTSSYEGVWTNLINPSGGTFYISDQTNLVPASVSGQTVWVQTMFGPQTISFSGANFTQSGSGSDAAG
ncbi:MAG: hypothetical protein NTW03_03970, partial [Verrucomicrobia bacterium]|nr:hypothetical protein [Verrucomicrobiota bacterium]